MKDKGGNSHEWAYRDAVTKLRVLLGDGQSNLASTVTESVQEETPRRRHNSWHNMIDAATTPPQYDTPRFSEDEMKALVEKQESYVMQLEAEIKFCRDQLAKTIGQMRETTASMNIEEDSDRVKLLLAENANLKKRLESNNEKVKHDNAWLNHALVQIQGEMAELQRREAEAVDQVKRSVGIAEQVRMEKAQLEMEVGQAKLQVERQQERIRGLIEEQVAKVEETRHLTEHRCHEDLVVLQRQVDGQSGQVGHLTVELEQSRRQEAELRGQLKDRQSLVEQVQEEAEKRLGSVHLEMVGLRNARTQLEHDLGCLRIDLDHARQELDAEASRNKAEVSSLKSRLQRSEEMLSNSREEAVRLSEAKSALERECNLLRHNSNSSSKNMVANECLKLRQVVQKQRQVIGQLKKQCGLMCDKLEMVTRSYNENLDLLNGQLEEATRKISVQEGQCWQSGSMYEKCCREIQALQYENKRALEQIDKLTYERDTCLRERDTQVLVNNNNSTKRPARQLTDSKKAIVIERKGRITTPL